MTTPARQKVVGIDVSKETLAISHLAAEKVQHLETKTTRLALKNWSSVAAQTAYM